jgi:hypothetical protein
LGSHEAGPLFYKPKKYNERFTKIVTSRTSKHIKAFAFGKEKILATEKKLRDPKKYSIKSQSGTVIGPIIQRVNTFMATTKTAWN